MGKHEKATEPQQPQPQPQPGGNPDRRSDVSDPGTGTRRRDENK